ncbi:MAG TPA: tRNA pseudouridine(55) synthase TruB [Steroidobacteraceae bacterium]|nr:tRNA pseudouridine(55) synthase TruB [Steroidobacteraceae bacterium]
MNGILLLDKPEGLSSNAALQWVRRICGADKAGHVGSLDPLATGMLPICLGEATKVAGLITGANKRYRFTVVLGRRTATGDREGAEVETAPVPPLSAAAIEAALSRFRGPQLQVPPMYSALKRDGQPLYRLARAGVEVERVPRPIEILELVLNGFTDDQLELEAVCSKGTYIRVLAQDLALALGSCGHVGLLRRLYVEPFQGQPMHTLESLGSRIPPLIPPDQALPQLPAVRLPGAAAGRLCQGQAVTLPHCSASGQVRLYEEGGGFLGLGEAAGGVVRPRRLLRTGASSL